MFPSIEVMIGGIVSVLFLILLLLVLGRGSQSPDVKQETGGQPVASPLQEGLLPVIDAFLSNPVYGAESLKRWQYEFGYTVYPIQSIRDFNDFWWGSKNKMRRWIEASGLDQDSFEKPSGSRALERYPGNRAIAYVIKELMLNIVQHGGFPGVILLRKVDGHIELIARDKGRGIRDLLWSMEAGNSGYPRWLHWFTGNSGTGLPNMLKTVVSEGRGRFTLMSNGWQLSYRDAEDQPVPGRSEVLKGTLVHILRALPGQALMETPQIPQAGRSASPIPHSQRLEATLLRAA